MSTLSVPLSSEMIHKIDQLVKLGVAPNKAELARKALEKFIEDEAVNAVLKAEQEIKDGKLLKGNLDELAKLL